MVFILDLLFGFQDLCDAVLVRETEFARVALRRRPSVLLARLSIGIQTCTLIGIYN